MMASSQSGFATLDFLSILLLAAACFLVGSSYRRSTIIEENEVRVVRFLRLIRDAEVARARPSSLPDLVATNARLASEVDRGSASGDVIVAHGHCFIVHTLDLDDEAKGQDFWLAYAWPVRYGETGLRVFVCDPLGLIRSADMPPAVRWSGPKRIPPIDAAPEPEGADYPYRAASRGLHRFLVWNDVR